MGSTEMVAVAAGSFVASHFLLSHPLRAPLVKMLGTGGFMAFYSLVAFAMLGWTAQAYRAAAPTPPFWPVGEGLWALATVAMLCASILLMGSLIGNPSLPGPSDMPLPDKARGAFAITRHPMMWSCALWGAAHILVYPVAANIIVAAAVIILALGGAALQDIKKAALLPGRWRMWEGRTSFWPFAAIVAGKARFGGFRPHDLAGGAIVWLVATWAHIPLAGLAAGIWRWI